MGKDDDGGGWRTVGGSRMDPEVLHKKMAAAAAKQKEKEKKAAPKKPNLSAAQRLEEERKIQKREARKARIKERKANEEPAPKQASLGKEALRRLIEEIKGLPAKYEVNPGAVWDHLLALCPPTVVVDIDADSDDDEEWWNEPTNTIDDPFPTGLGTAVCDVVQRAVVSDAEQRTTLKKWLPRLLASAFSAKTGKPRSIGHAYIVQCIIRSNADYFDPTASSWLQVMNGVHDDVVVWVVGQICVSSAESGFGIVVQRFFADDSDEPPLWNNQLESFMELFMDTEATSHSSASLMGSTTLRDLLRTGNEKLLQQYEAPLQVSLWKFVVQPDIGKFIPTLMQLSCIKGLCPVGKSICDTLLLRAWKEDPKCDKWQHAERSLPKEFAQFQILAKAKRIKVVSKVETGKGGVKHRRSWFKTLVWFSFFVLIAAVIARIAWVQYQRSLSVKTH